MKKFKCQKCGGSELALLQEVISYNDVDYDDEDNIIYSEIEDLIYEEYIAYICADCGHYLINNGVIVSDENNLKQYLELYGIKENKFENISK